MVSPWRNSTGDKRRRARVRASSWQQPGPPAIAQAFLRRLGAHPFPSLRSKTATEPPEGHHKALDTSCGALGPRTALTTAQIAFKSVGVCRCCPGCGRPSPPPGLAWGRGSNAPRPDLLSSRHAGRSANTAECRRRSLTRAGGVFATFLGHWQRLGRERAKVEARQDHRQRNPWIGGLRRMPA